jgi:hypothetical protein
MFRSILDHPQEAPMFLVKVAAENCMESIFANAATYHRVCMRAVHYQKLTPQSFNQ